jgi:hypothetical protein
MTKSMGARALRKRREELFSAELVLRRVLGHLLESIDWAHRGSDDAEIRSLWEAYSYVCTAYADVIAEQTEPR